ncbi:MAG: type II secretion system protein [Spirochaetales bacterium]|jgi:prepilin-type N-terminal cleavage/methylation domain-containing protein|nr:type II secretion system protein [Spirochaetales bacterium]
MKDRRQNGFTLIEIIIALVCISILAVMMVLFGGNITRSVSPVITLQKSADLQRGMDNVTRAYYRLPLPITHTNLEEFWENLVEDRPGYIDVTDITVDSDRTRFIRFTASNVEDDDPDLDPDAPNLKVTLVNSEGQSVSTIFTTR